MAVPLLLLIQQKGKIKLQTSNTNISATPLNVEHLPAELVQLFVPVVSALFAWLGALQRAPSSHTPPSFSQFQPEPPASARSPHVVFAVKGNKEDNV